MSIQINHPFLIQLLLFLWLKIKVLCIYISSLSDIRSANILCHPVGCLLASLMVSFAAYFNFVKFQFNFLSLAFFFNFICKALADSRWQRLPSRFSLQSFAVLALPFRSTTYSELISECKESIQLHSSARGCAVVTPPFIGKTLCPPELSRCPCPSSLKCFLSSHYELSFNVW